MALGTYQLVDNEAGVTAEPDTPVTPQLRLGRILLFTVQKESGSATPRLQLLQQTETDAVFDIKWHAREPLLAVASAGGYVQLNRLADNDTVLSEVERLPLEAGLCLSLDWAKEADVMDLYVSCQRGSLHCLKATPHGLCSTRQWQAHTAETWIVARSHWDTHAVFSGADDSLLKAWDTRTDCQRPTLISKR